MKQPRDGRNWKRLQLVGLQCSILHAVVPVKLSRPPRRPPSPCPSAWPGAIERNLAQSDIAAADGGPEKVRRAEKSRWVHTNARTAACQGLPYPPLSPRLPLVPPGRRPLGRPLPPRTRPAKSRGGGLRGGGPPHGGRTPRRRLRDTPPGQRNARQSDDPAPGRPAGRPRPRSWFWRRRNGPGARSPKFRRGRAGHLGGCRRSSAAPLPVVGAGRLDHRVQGNADGFGQHRPGRHKPRQARVGRAVFGAKSAKRNGMTFRRIAVTACIFCPLRFPYRGF